jgi:hypothetical protein
VALNIITAPYFGVALLGFMTTSARPKSALVMGNVNPVKQKAKVD